MTEQQEFDLVSSGMPSVTIYSDGAYKPALGTGGYGSIMMCNGFVKFCYGGFVGTSNNAMELLGAITPMRLLNQPCRVTIISDSQYLVKGLNEYLSHWVANGWRKADGGKIANETLWREMWLLCQTHIVSAHWVKGHSTNYNNSVCDNLASIGTYKVCGVQIPNHLLCRV